MIRHLGVLLAVVLLVGGAAAGSAASDPFKGKWTSVDDFDGSVQVLKIGGGAHHAKLSDAGASVCAPDLSSSATAKGFGTVAGATLTVIFRITCANGVAVPDATVVFTYDAATDTLSDTFTDGSGTTFTTVWSRA